MRVSTFQGTGFSPNIVENFIGKMHLIIQHKLSQTGDRNAVLLLLFLENDSGSYAIPGETDPGSPAPTQPQRGRWKAVWRLGGAGRALRAVACTCYPDHKVSVDPGEPCSLKGLGGFTYICLL